MAEQADNSARYAVVQKLASFFKIKKDDLQKDVLDYQKDNNTPILHSPILAGSSAGFAPYIYPVHADKIELSEFLDIDKFKKSKLFILYLEGEGHIPPVLKYTRFVLAVYVKGAVWFIYRSRGYSGIGGIYIGELQDGFSIEPIKNFLKHRFPRYIEGVDLD